MCYCSGHFYFCAETSKAQQVWSALHSNSLANGQSPNSLGLFLVLDPMDLSAFPLPKHFPMLYFFVKGKHVRDADKVSKSLVLGSEPRKVGTQLRQKRIHLVIIPFHCSNWKMIVNHKLSETALGFYFNVHQTHALFCWLTVCDACQLAKFKTSWKDYCKHLATIDHLVSRSSTPCSFEVRA